MDPKLLIVDDNSMLRKTTRDILESRFSTLRVFEAGNGTEAFSQIRQDLPHLILMDIRLPEQSGLELTREINRAAAFENGADFFYAKSSASRPKLTTMVESILAGIGF